MYELLMPEPSPMKLHVQRAIDTRAVAWPAQRLTSNDRKGKKLYDSDTVAMWRGLGYRAFVGVMPIPTGTVARVVVHYRQPAGRGKIRDPSNLHPITKALVDGMTHGPDGKRPTGLWPDDSGKYVIGQDERDLLPATGLEIVVQVWVGRK